jgi:hypothetical protein
LSTPSNFVILRVICYILRQISSKIVRCKWFWKSRILKLKIDKQKHSLIQHVEKGVDETLINEV